VLFRKECKFCEQNEKFLERLNVSMKRENILAEVLGKYKSTTEVETLDDIIKILDLEIRKHS